jgi:hypothetical protein
MSTPAKYIIVLLYEKDEYTVRRDESGAFDNYWLAYKQARLWTEERQKRK